MKKLLSAGLLPLVSVLSLFVALTLVDLKPARAQQSPFAPLEVAIQASAARSEATFNVADQTNNGAWKGVQVIVNISARTSGSYTPHVQAKDPVSGNYYDLLVGTALNGTGTTVLSVYPGIAASANVSASANLPRTWRVQLIGASTPSMTLSIGGVLLP